MYYYRNGLIPKLMGINNQKMCAVFAAVLFAVIAGCSRDSIKLESVYRTSDSLNCHTVFADTRKSIVEHSEILIQLGTLDTLEGSFTDVAIIHEHGKAIILDLLESKRDGRINHQLYGGSGYKLNLNYSVKDLDNGTRYHDSYFDGNCKVSHGKLYTEVDVEGVRNIL